MDKSWINIHRTPLKYENGVESFLVLFLKSRVVNQQYVLAINAELDITIGLQKMKWHTISFLIIIGHITKSGFIIGRMFLGLLVYYSMKTSILLLTPN